MATNFYIPVGRRYVAALADLDAELDHGTAVYNTNNIIWVDAGYADQNYHGVMTPSGMRVFSRSDLCRPDTRFNPVVRVNSDDFVGINCSPDSDWNKGATPIDSLIEFYGSTTNSAIYHSYAGLYLTNALIEEDDDKFYRTKLNNWPKMFTINANAFGMYVGAQGAVGSEFDLSAATTYLAFFSTAGTVINNNQGDFDFTVRSVAFLNNFVIDGDTGNVGFCRVADPYNATLFGISLGLNAGIMTADTQTGIYLLSNCYVGAAAKWINITAADASGYFFIASNGDFQWCSDVAAPVGAFVPTTKLYLDVKGNLRLRGVSAMDATAENCLVLANTTEPSAHTDNQIYIYSIDGTVVAAATLGLYTERIVDAGSLAVTHYLEVIINGANYAILLNDLEPMGP